MMLREWLGPGKVDVSAIELNIEGFHVQIAKKNVILPILHGMHW